MHLHKNASTGCFKKGLVCRLTKLFLWDTLYNYLLLNPPDRHSFMLSSGSASRMTHCIKSRFVRHHKYAEAAERKGGDPTFNNGGVKWALALEPRGATRFLWSWTRLEPELCGLQTCHGLQATHYVSALYRNFTNLRLQRDLLYCTFTSLRLLCPRFLSLAFASVSSPPPPLFFFFHTENWTLRNIKSKLAAWKNYTKASGGYTREPKTQWAAKHGAE